MENKNLIFFLMCIIGAIITIVLGVLLYNAVGNIIIVSEGASAAATSGTIAITICAILFPIIVVILNILGLILFKKNEKIALISGIITICLSIIIIIIAAGWLVYFVVVPPAADDPALKFIVASNAFAAIILFVQFIVLIGALLNIILLKK